MLWQIDSMAVGLAEVFGEQAHLVAAVVGEGGSAAGVLTSNPVYHIFSMLLLGLWALLIYGYHSEIPQFIHSTIVVKNVTSDEANPIFASLMRYAEQIAIVAAILLAVRVVESEFVPLPEWVERWGLTLYLVLFLAGGGLVMLQNLVLRIVGLVCGAHDFSHEAITLKSLFVGFWGLIITLPTLLLLLNHTMAESFVLHLITILTALTLLIYMFKSFLLFRRAKISILIWFLYLCTVEALPVTLLTVGIARQL